MKPAIRDLIAAASLDAATRSALEAALDGTDAARADAVARARDEERARLARDLHDGPAQVVGAVKLDLERLAARRPDAGELAPLIERLAEAFASLRDLARDLAPPELERLGLAGALERLAGDLGRRSGTRASFALSGAPRALGRDVERELYRIAGEAVANVARHADARTAAIELAFEERGARLAVADDGRGFALEPASGRGASGLGLRAMRERALALGADLAIAAEPGRGVRIEVRLARPASAPARAPSPSGGRS